MVTYSEAVVTSAQIAQRIETERHRLESAYKTILRSEQHLVNMEVTYGQFVTELNQQDGADPDWAALQGKTDKLVQNFLTLKAYATAVRQAVEAVE